MRDALYLEIMREFLRRIERMKARRDSNQDTLRNGGEAARLTEEVVRNLVAGVAGMGRIPSQAPPPGAVLSIGPMQTDVTSEKTLTP